MYPFKEYKEVPSANWVLEQPPAQVLVWINEISQGLQSAPTYFNWLGLAEVSTGLARYGEGSTYSTPNLDWAKVALAAYGYLISTSSPADHDSLEYSVMNLRAYLILKLGTVAGDPILDVDQIVHWFFQNLHLSIPEATRRAVVWKELSREEMLELRRIKNRLAVLKTLSEHDLLPPDPELQAWLALRNQLP